MIAVLDTNVWISGALTTEGIPAQVLDAWLDNQFELLYSPDLLSEIQRVFSYPKILKSRHYDQDRIRGLLEALERTAIMIDAEIMPADKIVRDPKDWMILALARVGGADYIVSGDEDLHAVGTYAGVVVVNSTTMLEILQNKSDYA